MPQKKFLTLFFITIFFITPIFSFAQNIDQESLIKQLLKQVQDLVKQIQDLQQQVSSIQSEFSNQPEIASSTAPKEAMPPKLTRNLYRGSYGNDVRELQKFLSQDKKIYPERLITGYFGPLTEKALKKWQEKNGIKPAGIVGSKTIAKFQEIGKGMVQNLIEQDVGTFGIIPPGLLIAPGIQKKIEIYATTTPIVATSTLIVATTTLSLATTTISGTGINSAITATTTTTASSTSAATATNSASAAATATTATQAASSISTTQSIPSTATTATTVSSTSATTTVATASSTPTTDITPPTISNIQTTNITETSATITWTTDELSYSKVSYAISSLVSATTTFNIIDSNNTTSHIINLINLSASKVYYYVVVSKDTTGNTATSTEQSFSTLIPLPPPSTVSSWSNNSLGVSGEYQSTAWNGNGYGVIYGWNGKLYFLKLDSNGNKLGEPVIFATAPNYVFWTNIVWDGSKYGIVWPEANPHNIRFAILDIDGNVLSNIAVTAGTDNADTERPAIIWTGNEYVLIWSGGWPDYFNNPYVSTKIIYFSKIAADGQTVIINKKKSITSGDARAANGPIVSAHLNGLNIGVLWQDIRDSGDSNNPALYFNILNNNGDKLISNDIKVSGAGSVGSPQIFADSENYIVFWRESAASNVNANSIYVAKLDATGNKILVNQNLNTKGDNEIRPSVVKTDVDYSIAWTSYPESKIYFKSISSSTSITINNELISTISGDNDNAYIVWGNNKYSVVWKNIQNNQLQLYFGTK